MQPHSAERPGSYTKYCTSHDSSRQSARASQIDAPGAMHSTACSLAVGSANLTRSYGADTTAPAIKCPTEVIEVEAGSTHLIRAIAMDAGGEPDIMCPDTATLPVGTGQAIECTATDASGNVGTCKAYVTVEGALAQHLSTACGATLLLLCRVLCRSQTLVTDTT